MALQAAMVMLALLLQKPHSKSKAADHTKHLERRLLWWIEGNLESLMDEGHTIQGQFDQRPNNQKRTAQQTAWIFVRHMMEGKMRAAL